MANKRNSRSSKKRTISETESPPHLPPSKKVENWGEQVEATEEVATSQPVQKDDLSYLALLSEFVPKINLLSFKARTNLFKALGGLYGHGLVVRPTMSYAEIVSAPLDRLSKGLNSIKIDPKRVKTSKKSGQPTKLPIVPKDDHLRKLEAALQSAKATVRHERKTAPGQKLPDTANSVICLKEALSRVKEYRSNLSAVKDKRVTGESTNGTKSTTSPPVGVGEKERRSPPKSPIKAGTSAGGEAFVTEMSTD